MDRISLNLSLTMTRVPVTNRERWWSAVSTHFWCCHSLSYPFRRSNKDIINFLYFSFYCYRLVGSSFLRFIVFISTKWIRLLNIVLTRRIVNDGRERVLYIPFNRATLFIMKKYFSYWLMRLLLFRFDHKRGKSFAFSETFEDIITQLFLYEGLSIDMIIFRMVSSLIFE